MAVERILVVIGCALHDPGDDLRSAGLFFARSRMLSALRAATTTRRHAVPAARSPLIDSFATNCVATDLPASMSSHGGPLVSCVSTNTGFGCTDANILPIERNHSLVTSVIG